MIIATPPSTRFAAMGSSCEVTVLGGVASTLLALARSRVEELEGRWSRFRPSSELTRINDGGIARDVSLDTFLLLDRAVHAWHATKGLFDPTVLHAVVDAGYDRSFELVRPTTGPSVARPAPGCAGVQLDPVDRSVVLPRGVGIDPGGIGKGLAADLVVEALLDAGARGACVSLGGDIRVAGEHPGDGWPVGVANPFLDGDLVSVVLLRDHGAATSSRLVRRWRSGDSDRNHLIDPRTGASVTGAVTATTLAGEAWWAEVLAKVAMVEPKARASRVRLLGGAALVIDADGSVEAIGDYQRFERPRAANGSAALATSR